MRDSRDFGLSEVLAVLVVVARSVVVVALVVRTVVALVVRAVVTSSFSLQLGSQNPQWSCTFWCELVWSVAGALGTDFFGVQSALQSTKFAKSVAK